MNDGNPSSPQSGLFRLTLGGLQQMAGWIASVLPDRDQRLVWQEFRNKALAFDLFANVESVLQLRPGHSYSAAELTERALRLDPYESAWAVEGVGHFLAERHPGAGQRLFDFDGAPVAARWLVPLHVGMGLSFANRILSRLAANPSPLQVREAVDAFIRLCERNSHPGFEHVAHEALGLVTRNIYSHLAQAVARQLAGIEPEIEEYFWHGVGRGLYFLPGNAMPASCAPWIAVNAAEREAPHDLARRNMLAGIVWAITLVNLRHPEILALFLKHHRDVVCQDDVFRNGLTSAILIWLDCSPEDPSFRSFLRYRPDPGDRNFCQLWDEQVTHPCRDIFPEGGLRPDERPRAPAAFRYKAYA
jgi:hypothetical protein